MSAWSQVCWQQLAGGSQIRRALVLVGCLALMLGMAYFIHLRALFTAVEQGAEHLQRLSAERVERGAQGEMLASSQTQLAKANQRLDEARWRLAAGDELAGLLEDIARLGQSHGVFVEQVELLPEVFHDQHVELPIQLQLQGTHLALAGFAHGLAGLPRLITLQDFSLLPVEASHSAGLRMQSQVFAYRSVAAGLGADQPSLEANVVRPLPSFSRSPFEPSPVLLSRQYLETVPIDQFEMIGSLARGEARFALLRVAGLIHRLQVGDRLGRDNGQVIRIEEQHVEITEEVFVQGKGWVEQRRLLSLKLPVVTG